MFQNRILNVFQNNYRGVSMLLFNCNNLFILNG